MKLLCRRSLVEVEVATENLVGSLARKHHLYAHRLYHTRQQIHRHGGTHGGYIVGLDEVDNVAQGVQSLLNGIVDFVMHRAYVVGYQTRLRQVGRSLESHGKRVETRPPGTASAVGLYTAFGVALGDGTDNAAVESAREQHSVGHVAHHLAFHGSAKTLTYCVAARRVVLHVVVLHPVALVPTLHSGVLAPVVVARQKRLVTLALTLQGLKLACHKHLSVGVVSDIKRYDAYMVAGDEESVLLLVIKSEGEDAVQIFEKVDALVAIKSQNNLAVAARLEIITPLVSFSYLLVVVYLTVHSQHLLAVGREQRLTSTLRVDNAQSLVRQYGASRTMNAAPVRTAVTYLLAHAKRLGAQLWRLLLNVEYCYYSAHNNLYLIVNKTTKTFNSLKATAGSYPPSAPHRDRLP